MTLKTLDLDKTSLGIELGSTRIKAVLIDSECTTIASGEYNWENRFEHGIWTYCLDDVWEGLQSAFKMLSNQVFEVYGMKLSRVGVIGFSAMMHGYLPFDKKGNQLTSFRTWRNTNTEQAAIKLTSLFKFNIPHRWSIAHLYQAILNNEEHISDIDYFTTLAGYVHWKLTGERVLGVGDASGMFPINFETGYYDQNMMDEFTDLTSTYNFNWSLKDALPSVRNAGEYAGRLTEEGAHLLDPSETLQPGILFSPPEGDAGTGMVATNSIKELNGNVSAGTSIFAMIVLDKPLSNYYKEIDVVTTPSGKPVAMVHCNNFTSDINAWINMFSELLNMSGMEMGLSDLYTMLFKNAMKSDEDVGGLTICSYYAGEPITQFEEGRPLLVRTPDSNLNLSNFIRAQIYSSLATMKIGMDILIEQEKIDLIHIQGHGGFFKTEKVGQQIMADVFKVPFSLGETAGEGGPWGMAILGLYTANKKSGQSLEEYLQEEVFNRFEKVTAFPSNEGVKSFSNYMKRFKSVLKVEQSAIEHL